jgi:mono/diheme cytochrome c family protein
MMVGRILAACTLVTSALWGQQAPFRARSAGGAVTFNNQIVRLLQKNCQTCHHPGDIAPFSLLTYQDALEQARAIQSDVQARKMPPWKPVAGYGEFRNERRLSQREIDLITRWVREGAPEGDPRDLPPPMEFPSGWRLGTPDAVLEPEAAFTVPADSGDIYRCFSIPLGLTESRYVTGIEVEPGNRSVVHHALLFQDTTGVSAQMASNDGQPGYPCFGDPGFLPTSAFGAWVPGNDPQQFPDGIGIKAAPGARLVLQIHYHPREAAQIDRTRVGLYFAGGPIGKNYAYLPIYNTHLDIPPGEAQYTITASFTVPPLFSAQAISITPHMHLLGRQIRVDAVYPDGARRPLIYIDDWDFDWQGTYYFKDPVPLPPLTRLELTAVYDNSAANPKNPNQPPKEVRWGEQTTDEMCIAAIGFVLE